MILQGKLTHGETLLLLEFGRKIRPTRAVVGASFSLPRAFCFHRRDHAAARRPVLDLVVAGPPSAILAPALADHDYVPPAVAFPPSTAQSPSPLTRFLSAFPLSLTTSLPLSRSGRPLAFKRPSTPLLPPSSRFSRPCFLLL